MKRSLLSLALLLLAAFTGRADQYQSQTIQNSGDSITITNGPAATSGTFNYSIVGGTPATLSIVLQGCVVLTSTCTTLDTYSLVANTNRTPTISTAYDNFTVQASWTGCTNCSVVIGSTLHTPAAASVSGVASFNTRTGAIVPTSGDYTAAQVTGAAPSSSPTFTGNVTGGTSVTVASASTLASALALCSTCTINISATVTAGANVSIPTTTILNFSSGGTLALGGFTINFQNGYVIAPPVQIFTGSGSVTNLGGNIIPDWFAASSSSTALTLAAAACPSGNVMCQIQLQNNKTYTSPWTSSALAQNNVHIFGVQRPSLDIAIGGLASGTYTSGITATGTGTCILTFTNGAKATVPASSGAITGGATLTITATGQGAFATPNTATVSVGTASTCATSTISISGWTASGQILTFTATNTLVAGQQVILSGFTGSSTWLNGQTVTVLAAGLTGSVFSAYVTGTVGVTSSGTAAVTFVSTVLTTPSQLVDGSIVTPTFAFSGNNIELDHFGVDDGPTLQTANPQNTLVVSCTTSNTLPCGHNGSVHDVITLGNSASAAFHGQLIGEGYDNFRGYNLETYWNQDGVVSKCTNCIFYNVISKGHSVADAYFKSDSYGPLNNLTFWGFNLGVITPGDSAVGVLLQASTAPGTAIAGSGISIAGVTNGLSLSGGSTAANSLSDVSLTGISVNGATTTGLVATGFVSGVSINGYSLSNSASWAQVLASSNPNVTNLTISGLATDAASQGGCLNGTSNRIYSAPNITPSGCSTFPLPMPVSTKELANNTTVSLVSGTVLTTGQFKAQGPIRLVALDVNATTVANCTVAPVMYAYDITANTRMGQIIFVNSTVNSPTATAATGATVLVVSSNTGIAIGQTVTGTGIAPGTLVTVVSGTNITIDVPTTGTLSATSVTFTGGSYYHSTQATPLLVPQGDMIALEMQSNGTCTTTPVINATLEYQPN
jgi:hypothetical protein